MTRIKFNHKIDNLWNDITLVYEYFNFKRNYIFDNLMMLSKDNYYMISYKNEKTNIKIKIEKDYNLINMWNDNSKDGAISYNLYVSFWDKTYTEENIKIEKAYEALLPYLRQIKIEKVGI